jgi:hypothetical protein
MGRYGQTLTNATLNKNVTLFNLLEMILDVIWIVGFMISLLLV